MFTSGAGPHGRYDQQPEHDTGIVCFITVAGFLAGPGFQKMRDYMRRTCDDIWVIDCSPEGHQPEVNTRIFQGVQQPVCIVLASRSKATKPEIPAKVHFRALPIGKREHKFETLAKVRLSDDDWVDAPSEWRAPFLTTSQGQWAKFPRLEELFVYNGSGVMPGRTWIIAPDAASLRQRWKSLVEAPAETKEQLFHPHLRNGQPGDKHSRKIVPTPLHGFVVNKKSVADDVRNEVSPIHYGFRSFDRQWIVADARLINQPNPELWRLRTSQQIFLTALTRTSPTNGPAVTFTANIPDLDHYRGSFGGRVLPLWADEHGTPSNVRPRLLTTVSERLGTSVRPEDFFAYIAAIAASPAYTARFQEDLSTPGLRIPITADVSIFREATGVGKRVLWLHTFGERMADTTQGRPEGPPRLPEGRAPTVPKEGEISRDPKDMPDTIGYDAAKQRLLVGHGFIDNVPPAVWQYEVSGKQVLLQWFSYRKKDRARPIMGDRRPPSPLGNIQPDHWLPEYTTELLNVLNVLAMLVELEPKQAELLDRICAGPLISEEELKTAGALAAEPAPKRRKPKTEKSAALFE
jgi:predicted helicase